MAAHSVNSPGPRRSGSVHLNFLCRLQAFRMHSAEPRVRKNRTSESAALDSLEGEEASLVEELLRVRTAASSLSTS